jgi:predicted AlkP superfamily phosphohydrolase/phosphomutase
MRGTRKVLVIGLDGASWNLLRPMLRMKLLPHLEMLIQSGTSGNLLSVDPPISPSSWASFITGQNPGKHGIYDFGVPVPGGYHLRLANATMIAPDSLWSVLGQNGKRLGVINVPMTFPPQKANGFIVSGMMTPSPKSSFTFPEELKQELIDQLGTYHIELDFVQTGKHLGKGYLSTYFGDHYVRFLNELAKVADARQGAINYLMDTQPWDFFMAVLTGTDRIQHYMWDYITQDFAGGDPRAEIRRRALDYYRRVDAIIGDMLDRADDDTAVIVLSDHGFGPAKYEVCLNKWLADIGMLAPSRGLGGKLMSWLGHLMQSKGISRERLAKILKLKRIEQVSALAATIDWSQTRASQRLTNSIHLNVRGRDPEGIVEPGKEYESLREFLIGELLKLEDPDTGQTIVTEALRKQDLYSGPYLENAPDIVLRFRDGYFANRRDLDVPSYLTRPTMRTGEHQREGILIAKGPGIREQFTLPVSASILDIFPTVLYLYDCPIPAKTDGKVLFDIFTPEFRQEYPVEYSQNRVSSEEQLESFGFTEQEEQDLVNRLKGLGYLE